MPSVIDGNRDSPSPSLSWAKVGRVPRVKSGDRVQAASPNLLPCPPQGESASLQASPTLTLLQDAPKGLAVTGAVPASETELELTFSDPQPCAPGELCHHFRLCLAQLSLPSRQPPGLPADAGRIHDQRATHSPGEQNSRSGVYLPKHKRPGMGWG